MQGKKWHFLYINLKSADKNELCFLINETHIFILEELFLFLKSNWNTFYYLRNTMCNKIQYKLVMRCGKYPSLSIINSKHQIKKITLKKHFIWNIIKVLNKWQPTYTNDFDKKGKLFW